MDDSRHHFCQLRSLHQRSQMRTAIPLLLDSGVVAGVVGLDAQDDHGQDWHAGGPAPVAPYQAPWSRARCARADGCRTTAPWEMDPILRRGDDLGSKSTDSLPARDEG